MGTGTLCLRLLSKNWRNWLTRGQFLPDHLLLKSIKMPSQQQTQTHQYHPQHLSQNFTSNKTGDNIFSFLIIEIVNTTEWQVQSYLNWFLVPQWTASLTIRPSSNQTWYPKKTYIFKAQQNTRGSSIYSNERCGHLLISVFLNIWLIWIIITHHGYKQYM